MAQNLLSNPELLRQLTQMQQTIQQNEALKSELSLQHPKPDDNDMSYSSDTRNSPPSVSQVNEFEHCCDIVGDLVKSSK